MAKAGLGLASMLPSALRDWEIRLAAPALDSRDEAAWRATLDEWARPVRAALAETVSRVRGPDWPEQAWDSYQYATWLRQHWAVQAPLSALPYARTPLVPVIAAGSILGAPLGKPYRKYWGRSKGYLAVVAEVAARFPKEGDHLAGELRARVPRLPLSEQEAVQLHLAALGLLDQDPVKLAQELLRQAADDDLGGRGELLLHTLDGIRDLPAEARRALLSQAALVAQRTTAFVASNPFAAVLEAMSAESLGGVGDLAELLDRAVELKIRDWIGWDRALDACSRALTGLVRRQGESLAQWALTQLDGYRYDFPALGAELRLATARALPYEQARPWAAEALEVARQLKPTRSALRAEVAAASWLAEHDPGRGTTELRTTSGRVLRRRWGAGREAALRMAVVALANIDTGDEARVAEAIELQQGLRSGEGRWLSAIGVATSPSASEAVAAQQFDFARQAMRWRLFRHPPLKVLGPLVDQLAAAVPGGLRHRLAQRLGQLTIEAAEGRCSGPDLATRWISDGPAATAPEATAALAAVAQQPDLGWWRLPLLAMVSDCFEVRIETEARRRSGTVLPDEQPSDGQAAIGP